MRYIIKIYHVPMCGKLLDSEFTLVGVLVIVLADAGIMHHLVQILVTIDGRRVLLARAPDCPKAPADVS